MKQDFTPEEKKLIAAEYLRGIKIGEVNATNEKRISELIGCTQTDIREYILAIPQDLNAKSIRAVAKINYYLTDRGIQKAISGLK